MTNEPKPLEAEVLPTQAVSVREQHQSLAAAQPLTMQQVRAGLNAIHEVMRDCMTDGQDYGKVPGCGDKPGLFQPGAQKLSMMFQLNPAVQSETVTDYPNFHRGYRLVIRVTNGSKFAEGVGECSTMESKYRYRNANKVCPHCGKDTVFRSKNDPEWYCWQKKGGCGNVFKDGSPMAAKISEQTSGKVEHDNPADFWNTVRKMAFKRAFVHAIINATNTSELWSQDLEDLAANGVVTGADRAATADRANQHANETAESPPASRRAAAPQSADRPAPARPAATGSPGDGLWKSVTVPKFIKKYAGSTLGEMAEKDLRWWCENYEPKPWKGKILQADLDFKAGLDAAWADLPDNGESNNDGGNVGPADDDSVPF